MGIFEIFKKKPNHVDAGPSKLADDEAPAPGWQAIERAFEGIYPGQTSPAHVAPLVYRRFDRSDNAAAFDGISVYAATDHWHFVTFGLSELYGKESEDASLSGFGYELTFKLPRLTDRPARWAFDFLEAIGKQIWNGMQLAPGHTIQTGPLDGRSSTRETAVLVVRDPTFPDLLQTPHGQLELLLLVGVEDDCRQRVRAAHRAPGSVAGWETEVVAEIRAKNPNLVTPIVSSGAWGTK